MPRSRPQAGCHEVEFTPSVRLDEASEVALEDYARALTRGAAAEAVRSDPDPSTVRGIHLCGLAGPVSAEARRDLEDFARSMAGGGGGGLGWS